MTASSVTGTGPGAAKQMKGPGNGRNQFVPVNGPHIVAAGTDRFDNEGQLWIYLQNVPGSDLDYAVIVTGFGGTTAPVVSGVSSSDGFFTAFYVLGSADNYVHWLVVKKGQI